MDQRRGGEICSILVVEPTPRDRAPPMPRIRLSTFLLLLVIVAMALGLIVLAGREARLRAELQAVTNRTEDAIQRALDRPIRMDWIAGLRPSLSVVLLRLKSETRDRGLWSMSDGLPIYVDPEAASNAGITLETTSEPHPPETMTIGEALSYTTQQFGLRWYVKDALLIISDDQAASGKLSMDELVRRSDSARIP